MRAHGGHVAIDEVSRTMDAHEPARAHPPVRAASPPLPRAVVIWSTAFPFLAGIAVVVSAFAWRSSRALLLLLPLLPFVVLAHGLRFAHEVVIQDGSLSWRGLIRRGQVPVADLAEIGWTSFLGSVVFRDRRGRRIYASRRLLGLAEVIDRVQALNPDLSVTLSPQVRQQLG
jgi:hypothetical protein